MRVGVASIVQETNTFSPLSTTLHDFESQGLYTGEDVAHIFAGTNTEIGGALGRLLERRARAVPLVRAWAMSSGRLTAETFETLCDVLGETLRKAAPLDGLVLSLHGAMAAENADDADVELLRTARAALVSEAPIGVCLDLHANVTQALVADSAFVVGYHTYPHVDQGETGARAADLLLDELEGRRRPVTRLSKRPLLIAPEAQTAERPLGAIREEADCATSGRVLDVSLFPVQPWLDVPELGFAVTVTTDGAAREAAVLAEHFAERAWRQRGAFTVDLVDPAVAVARVRTATARPVLLAESADSPTAGAPADSPAAVRALLEHGRDLRAYVTVVDAPAVRKCLEAGAGSVVSLVIGCRVDARFHHPVSLEGRVRRIGDGAVALRGPVFRGMIVTMGRWAVVDSGRLSVLLTELPACTFDPEVFRHVGLAPEQADAIVVRSANLFRAGYADLAREAIILDLPGASTPRLETLKFLKAPRPLYPVDHTSGDL